jgi:pimeloyl-ACP methyl ester carboxylesterase
MERFDHDGLRFELSDRGGTEAPAVVLLHGFPADRHSWDVVADRLAGAGYRVLAPDQRGYSPGARPAGRRCYVLDALSGDVLALADQAGLRRFHVVGHDLGALVAWHLAGTAPGRVASLTAVSVPHPRAMAVAVRRGPQALRSWYVLAFQVPALPERILAWRNGALLHRMLVNSGLGAEAAARYSARAARPGGLTGPIGWYRALPLAVGQVPTPVAVPTLMIWSPGDRFVSRAAAQGAAACVAGPYLFVEIPGAPHWLPEAFPDAVAGPLLSHLGSHPL